MEWTGGILVSIRAELYKEKLGEELVATVCVHTCVCAWLCVGVGMCVGVHEFPSCIFYTNTFRCFPFLIFSHMVPLSLW